MKKTVILLFFSFLALNVFSQKQLKNFNEIFESLKSGKDVKAIFYYGQCQLISDNEIEDKSPDAIGGLTITTFEYFAQKSVRNDKAFIATSESKLIEYPKGDGYVYNYVKIKIVEDNKVKITARYIDAKTMEVLMDENFFTEINDGNNKGAAYFYEM